MQTMPTIPAKSLWKPHPWRSGAMGNAVTIAAWDTEHTQAVLPLQYILFHLEVWQQIPSQAPVWKKKGESKADVR